MRRTAIVLAATFGLCTAYVVAHWALIELGREVIVLRTEKLDGEWRETRLWIVDDGARTSPCEVRRSGSLGSFRRARRRVHDTSPPRTPRCALAGAPPNTPLHLPAAGFSFTSGFCPDGTW